jgi:hypothetical protein
MYCSAPRTPSRVPAAAGGRAKARRLAPPLPPPPPLLLLLLLLLAAITDRGSCGDVLGSSTAAGSRRQLQGMTSQVVKPPKPADDGVAGQRPHFVTVLADDLGYWDTQIQNPAAPTPRIKEMMSAGMRLDRHYVFRYCSPTRRAFLSGRFPNHISNAQAPTCSNYLPLQFTILSEKLVKANYTCHFVGKGHLGWLTEDHLMINRGFSSHVGYLGGAEAYTYGGGDIDPARGKHDFWSDHSPAFSLVPDVDYSANFYSKHTTALIQEHATRRRGPLWLHFTIQNVRTITHPCTR